MSAEGSSTRSDPRYTVELDCTIVASGTTLHARTRNLSRSGISCTVPRSLTPGTEAVIEMALSFPGDARTEPIRLPATIMWCTKVGPLWQLGARFEAAPARTGELLEVFVQVLEGIGE